VAALAVLTQAH